MTHTHVEGNTSVMEMTASKLPTTIIVPAV